jgi:hypothetical protein
MKARGILGSGKGGEIVALRNRSGQCQAQHRLDAKAPTPAQYRSPCAFGAASLGWNDLTGEQCDVQCEAGRKFRSRPRGGQPHPWTAGTVP